MFHVEHIRRLRLLNAKLFQNLVEKGSNSAGKVYKVTDLKEQMAVQRAQQMSPKDQAEVDEALATLLGTPGSVTAVQSLQEVAAVHRQAQRQQEANQRQREAFMRGVGFGTSSPVSPIEESFTHHEPTQDQCAIYGIIRANAKGLAYVIDHNCPGSKEKAIALEKLEEAVMWANKAISIHG
jgi:hypothetical protein